MLCVLHVIAIGLCLGAAGQFIEQVLPAALPRRWIWLVVMAMSVIVLGIDQRGPHRSHPYLSAAVRAK